jgi:hypothetical protein
MLKRGMVVRKIKLLLTARHVWIKFKLIMVESQLLTPGVQSFVG